MRELFLTDSKCHPPVFVGFGLGGGLGEPVVSYAPRPMDEPFLDDSFWNGLDNLR